MKKLEQIERLVEEALNQLDFKDTNCWREILTDIAKKCAEINEEDFDYYSRKILYYNSRIRDGQVEEVHPAIQHINAEDKLSAETVGAINKLAEVAYNTPMKHALQPLPEEMPEWFMKGHVSAIRVNNWNAVIQHFGTQPRDWWHDLKKEDKFIFNNGANREVKIFNGIIDKSSIKVYLGNEETEVKFVIDYCSPYTDPTQSFREKLTPEMQVEFDKLMERNKT